MSGTLYALWNYYGFEETTQDQEIAGDILIVTVIHSSMLLLQNLMPHL